MIIGIFAGIVPISFLATFASVPKTHGLLNPASWQKRGMNIPGPWDERGAQPGEVGLRESTPVS